MKITIVSVWDAEDGLFPIGVYSNTDKAVERAKEMISDEEELFERIKGHEFELDSGKCKEVFNLKNRKK